MLARMSEHGIDFVVLEPRSFAIAAFVALPGAAAFAVAAVLERLAPLEPWRVSRWAALLVVPALPAFVALPRRWSPRSGTK